ncbi:hypothetical protein LCGC14_0359280 [marine sediment metagenome]|uniref:DNA (cytosine-5-)-methyltransferase n=1 Tax=marine sediment metagenome TaxID=412755 RepID=A0A0F9WGM1_9ZZZZ|nr:DNA cytosine methyltransferase [Candidatus Aminicenantes bacterium]
MDKLKALNLYAGIGGNRKLWEDVEVTAIENNEKIAAIYQNFFPDDTVIVADAHEYLLQHFKEFDFIWSSPPCPTHSNLNRTLHAQNVIRYPDMKLYQEIIFLMEFYKGKYAIENVIPYYKPFIDAQMSGRHLFWCNFIISDIGKDKTISITNSQKKTTRTAAEHRKELQDYHKIDCDNIKYLSNCVCPELGKHILDCARSKPLF